METVLKINNLKFSYSKKQVFENFNLELKEQNVSILGTPSSGKTTLAKILSGIYKINGINIYNLDFKRSNLTEIKKLFLVVLNDLEFVAETVEDELAFGLENLCIDVPTIRKKINEIISYFELEKIQKMDPYTLSIEDKALIKILSFVIMSPKMVVIDDLISYLSIENKTKLFTYLKKIKIKIINITSNIEEIINTDYVYVLNNGKIVSEGKSKKILNEEKTLKRLGFGLPFLIDLSKQLIAYDLIDKVYYDREKLVNEIWK